MFPARIARFDTRDVYGTARDLNGGIQMRDTRYAREIASASVNEARVERLFIKAKGQDEIRFSWWKDGRRLMPRALDLPEAELVELLSAGIDNDVFTDRFLADLAQVIATHPARA